MLTDEKKKYIVRTFWSSFKREYRSYEEYPSYLFITKSKFYPDAVTFNDEIENIKKNSDETNPENKETSFLHAQIELLYFYISLNNEKQIVSLDSHYNNIMILLNYNIALIDNKQYLKVNLENSQYINDVVIYYFINLLINTYNSLYYILLNALNTNQKQKTKNIIYLLFCEFYANTQRDSLPLKSDSVDELYLIELLKNPFEEDKDKEYNKFDYILSNMPDIPINETNWIIDNIINELLNRKRNHQEEGGKKRTKKRTKKRNQSNRQRKKQQIKKQKRKRSRKLMV
uniref:Uncharacterized protein n=1 Tax=viral metagenome TaxID=1070528 RepID=A0A6C0DLA1_9ZZZZ